LGTGTSQGVPVIGCRCEVCLSGDKRDKRLRTSVMISTGGKNLVVDCGPDFRQQMLQNNVNSIDAILLTHEHNDHIIGLDDVRPFNFMSWKDMAVYASEQVGQALKKRFSYIFSETPYPGAPMIRIHPISKSSPFYVNGIRIIPVEAMHGPLPVLGFRIGDFTYLTDVRSISEEELAKVEGSKVLVLNALHRKPHHSHLNLEQALELIARLHPQSAYLTHMSHTMGRHETVSKELPANVFLAFDELTIVV
jgi:phosphoribosyl 1,2-cyclic phosphate phosphodiesterase